MKLYEQNHVENSSTGLFSQTREEFFFRVQSLISKLKPDKESIIFIRFDIDKFRLVNEDFGFITGDRVLEKINQRLIRVIEDGQNIFYLGNGEYAVAIPLKNKSDEKKYVCELCSILKKDINLESHTIKLNYSFGVVQYPGENNNVEELVLAAESAKQLAKEKGGDQINYFCEVTHNEALLRSQLIKELEHAIRNNEFYLVYQPKVDSTSGIVKGFEALLRWQHPLRGTVSPVEFIPVLEESMLITEVGDWVIRETCRIVKKWIDMGIEVVPVAVNVSTHQFKQAGFVERLDEIISSVKLDPHLLEIEITESCLMDDVEENVRVLENIKEKGIRISIDDFGTGYSSLSYLQRLPIDTLKIDRSFITNVDNRKESDNAGIVTAIMALSHSLRLNVVAEGVESARELAFLHALGCRTIQGFLFSKPLKEEAVLKLLKETESMQKTLQKVRDELQSETPD